MKLKLTSKRNMLRLFSLLAAFFIWIYVVSSAEILISQTVPLQIQVPETYAIKNFMEKEVQYRLKGPGLFVRKFIEQNLLLNIQAKDYYKKGKTKYRIAFDRSRIKLPLGVELVDIQPRQIFIELGKSLEKEVMIKPLFEENVLANADVTDFKLEPTKVKIVGPKAVVRKIKYVETASIAEINVNESRSFMVELKQPDARVSLSMAKAKASYTVQSKLKQFTFTDIPIIFQSASIIKTFQPKKVSVVIEGDRDIVERLKSENIKVMAYVPNDGRKGAREVELEVELAQSDLKVVSIKPSKIQVKLE